MEDPLLRFVLARSESNTKRPYFDDLSHHSLTVAFSQIHRNDPILIIAGLLHDLFKGLIYFNNGWNHVSEKKEHYEKIIPQNFNKTDNKKIIELIQHHHKRYSPPETDRKDHEKIWKRNPIKLAETGAGNLKGIVGTLESGIFISQDKDIYSMKHIKILPKGRYHWLLLSAIHEELKKHLSELYSRKLKELLNVSSLEFRYVPVSFSENFDSLTQYVDEIELEKYCLFTRDDCLVISMPVRDLCREFTIIYDKAEDITMANNTIIIPFGEALALFAFTENEIVLSYVDPGFAIDLTILFERILKKSKKRDEFPYPMEDLKLSLEGKFKATDNCSFCGNPASETISSIVKGDRFTDINLLFNDRVVACPVCFAGYLLERENVFYIKPQEAEIYDVQVEASLDGEISNDFAPSASGLMWQQVLSAIWYSLFAKRELPGFVLDPCVSIHPIVLRYAPRAFFPMAWQKGIENKKYCLQSTVNSGLTALGSTANISTEEFKELSAAYRINKDRIDKGKMLGKIKSIYGIRV